MMMMSSLGKSWMSICLLGGIGAEVFMAWDFVGEVMMSISRTLHLLTPHPSESQPITAECSTRVEERILLGKIKQDILFHCLMLRAPVDCLHHQGCNSPENSLPSLLHPITSISLQFDPLPLMGS